jgi:hypothetical protein
MKETLQTNISHIQAMRLQVLTAASRRMFYVESRFRSVKVFYCNVTRNITSC